MNDEPQSPGPGLTEPRVAPPGPTLEISPARLFTPRAMLTVAGYGFLLMFPVLLSLLAVSVVQFSLWTWLVPLLALGVATLFLPFGFGNPHVQKLARRLPGGNAGDPERFLVQVTFSPRLTSGVRARMEDADDIGWLSVSDTTLLFQGDAVNLAIPFENIQALRLRSIGLRGIYLYPCVTLSVSGLPRVQTVTLAERSCWFLPSSRAVTRRLCARLAEKLAGRKPAR